MTTEKSVTDATQAPPGLRPMRLSLSESQSESSPEVQEAAGLELRNIRLYPGTDGEPLISILGSTWNIDKERVVIGNGADELLLLIALTCRRIGRHRAAVASRTFAGHESSLRAADLDVQTISTDETGVSFDEMIHAVTKADVLYLCNPHNPTGTILSTRQMAELIDLCCDRDCLLVIDEAYGDFADRDQYNSAMRTVGDDRPIVVIRSLSKSHGLAGLRIGFTYGPKDFITELKEIAKVLPFRVNRIALAAATAALAQPELLQSNILRVRRTRTELRTHLREMGLRVPNSQTNFLFVHIGRSSSRFVEQLKQDHGIEVRDATPMGFPGWARIGVCAPDQVLRLTAAFSRVLSQIETPQSW